jgi:phytoene dehydrogenase-like protein
MLFFKSGGEMHSFNEQKSETGCFALIIGGGLGGLATGAKLARSGKKVFLIEQNDSIGGFARVIQAKSFVHEFSLHQLSGFEEGNLLREILREFGLFDQLEFVKLPNFYRSAIGKIHITLPHSLGHAAAILLEEFPSESKGIRKFFDVLSTLNKEVNRWIRRGCDSKFLYPLYPLLYPRMVRYAKTSVGKFLDAITKNDELKLIFLRPYCLGIMMTHTRRA